ncbi:class I SAM-dependent methyltransferase [Tolypothrix sp. PCC 7910]|uniref:class I SAM-dependent methyltransferase n=1 Tax=Tolypothrix sp. PCC 7910 TaxID=2099387 RepID=UPI0014278E38|nr:class I SAM-dependent methyltransferase [Tolypothrix sp. PCC 7910]QIR37996.1 class I SAM-dependent methyltransferase [Tolypothrix sp. PCC 7910]
MISTNQNIIKMFSPELYKWIRNTKRKFSFKLSFKENQWKDCLSQCKTNEEVFKLAQKIIPAAQIQEEILALITFLNKEKPSSFLEIGLSSGGTHFLIRYLCPSIQKSIGIDIDLQNTHIIDTLTTTYYHYYIEGRSDKDKTINTVKSWLKYNSLDVLFIDGDHSYEGVKNDFELYRHFVRDGGIIVFHDIVPDHQQKWGKNTDKYSGGVPLFFKEVSEKYTFHKFINEPNQDGFGIGLIIYRSEQ